MTVLPQGERELLDAHERLKRRRSRRLLGLPARISSLRPTSRPARRRTRRRAGSRRRIPRITVGAVTLMASVLVVFGVAGVFLVTARKPQLKTHAVTALKPQAPTQASSSQTRQHVRQNGIARALITNFTLLRRPVRPSDRLPAALAKIAVPNAPLNGDSMRSSLGLIPRLAREVTLTGTRFRAWLIPGRRGLCWDAEYAGQELGVSCSSFQHPATALAATNGYDSVKTRTGLITIGLVTDRVLGLELIRPHKPRTQVPISDGFYIGSGISGRTLIARTATGSQVLLHGPGENVLNTVPSPIGITAAPSRRGTQLAQFPLRSPAGSPTAGGIGQIYKSMHGRVLSLTVSGVGLTGFHDAYAVWLYTDQHTAQLLGFITHRQGRAGTLTTSGPLPSNAGRYRHILVTLETQTRPKTPGKILLIGPLRLGG